MAKNHKAEIAIPDVDMKSILESAPGYIYWKNLDSVYVGCNQEFLQVTLTDDIENVIGKTDFTLPWGARPEIAAKFVKDDHYVINTGNSIVVEDNPCIKNSRGQTIIIRTEKKPLYDKQGNIVGVLGIAVDITDQKEADRLRLQEKEKLITLAHKVAHDISSPLTALHMMVQLCNELPENKRSVIKQAAESILDIANNLLSTYRNEESRTSSIEPIQPVLVSDLISQLLSEKKVQYGNHAVKFEANIANNAQFAFIDIQNTEFRRSISNLINNAVDAFDNESRGLVTIHVTATSTCVNVAIEDNGKGMPEQCIKKIHQRQRFTNGKKQGHGLGLQQVWDMLEHNQGQLNVQSTLGQGSTIQVTFPRVLAANWIAQQIHITFNQIIIILDDEESIHGAWDMRFTPLLVKYPQLQLHHFTQGKDVLSFMNDLQEPTKARVALLSDYELLKQSKNGLEIIQATGVKHSILVTSHYANPKVRDAATALGVKILPKQMASVVPIDVK